MGPRRESRRASMLARKIAIQKELERKTKLDCLQRDIKLLASERAKIEQKWRQILISLKSSQHEEQVKASRKAFDRAYDTKNGVIKHILKLKQTANCQYNLSYDRFVDIVENSIQMYISDIDNLNAKYKVETARLLHDGSTEFIKTDERFKCYHTDIAINTLYAKTLLEAQNNTERGYRMVKVLNDAKDCEMELDNLVSTKDQQFCSVWQQVKDVLQSYYKQVSNIKNKTRIIRTRIQRLEDLIATQTSQIELHEIAIKDMQREYDDLQVNSTWQNAILRRNEFRQVWRKVTQKLRNEKARDKHNIEQLVKLSNEACDRITHSGKTCIKIIRMIALCRKHETLDEKTAPIGWPSEEVLDLIHRRNVSVRVAISRLLHKARLMMSDFGIDCAIAATSDYNTLLYRIGRIELLCRALRREKKVLLKENDLICAQLSAEKETNELSPVTSEYKCLNPRECKENQKTKLPLIISSQSNTKKLRRPR